MSCLQMMILGLNHLLVDQLKKHNQIGGVWGRVGGLASDSAGKSEPHNLRMFPFRSKLS
jgi:hypothetical protein